MSAAKERHLPPNLEPLAVSREEAADLFGISPSTFDRLVADGTFPQPVHVYSRRLWDVSGIKAAWRRFAAASAPASEAAEEKTWDGAA
jgi:predicted DNA-binding transcriptional regulator AlpA